MQKICTILIFIAFSFQLVAKLGVVALYEANKDYIAANLCENRAKPKMHCNGKCYLKKQLKKTEENEKQGSSSSKSETFQFTVFILPSSWAPQGAIEEKLLKHHSNYQSPQGIHPPKDILHPPQFYI